VGVSADQSATLHAFAAQHRLRHLLLSDSQRQMLPAYNALVTDERSLAYRQAKRAYFIIDRGGIVRFARILDTPQELLSPEEVLAALQHSGA